jgi:hypothetical protein
MKKQLEKLKNEIKELKSDKRKLVHNIEGIFHILHDDCLVNKDELSELLELLNKYKSPECLLLSAEVSSIIQK